MAKQTSNGEVMKYTVLLREGNEKGYVAIVPSLPGCVTQGSTKREALKNAKEAIAVYIEALVGDGLSVPKEVGSSFVEVEVTAH
jgi:predicted RNase H-like HicB family nuclease